jgi:hypothetical protein
MNQLNYYKVETFRLKYTPDVATKIVENFKKLAKSDLMLNSSNVHADPNNRFQYCFILFARHAISNLSGCIIVRIAANNILTASNY